MSEGIYTGIAADAKQLFFLFKGKKLGIIMPAIIRFLHDEWPFESLNKEQFEIYKELREQFDRQGHSGGSAVVATMMMLELLAGRNLSDAEWAYVHEGETIQEMAKKTLEEAKK